MSKNNVLFERPIAFHPQLARLLGGINEAILWQQLNYWMKHGRRPDGYIYKTKEELQEETTLTRHQQDKARMTLEKLGVLSSKLVKANRAPTLHYKTHPDAVIKLFGLAGNRRINKPETGESMDKPETGESITETTREYIQEDFSEKKSSSSKPELPPSKEYTTIEVDSWGWVKPAGKSKVDTVPQKKIKQAFSDTCFKTLGVRPTMNLMANKIISFAIATGKLTEAQILDLFEEWFLRTDKQDEQLIEIRQALSTHNINGYKVRNNIK